MYFKDSGRIKMVINAGDNEIILATLDSGDFFGEMALLPAINVLLLQSH
jgi:CRP-like cAMP-binding protein